MCIRDSASALLPPPQGPLDDPSAAAAELAPSGQSGRTRAGRPGDTGDRTLSPEELSSPQLPEGGQLRQSS
eukprot:4261339-Prorocentrum_lima.AAC.1